MSGSALPKVTKIVRPLTVASRAHSPETEAVRETIRQTLETNCRLMCGPELAAEIHVKSEMGEQTCVYFIDCPQPALGKILGSGGKNINALRTLFGAMCSRAGFRAVIEVAYHDSNQ